MNTVQDMLDTIDFDLYVDLTNKWQEQREKSRRRKVVRIPGPKAGEQRDPNPEAPDKYSLRAAVCTLLFILAIAAVLVYLGCG